MRTYANICFSVMVFLILMVSVMPCYAATKVRVRGLVRDSLTHQPVPHAAVTLKGTDAGALTNEAGVFEIYTASPFKAIQVTASGYEPKSISPSQATTHTIISLTPSSLVLDEVSVTANRKYSKRNNPAVELMKRVRENMRRTDPTLLSQFHRRRYERITLGINNFDTLKNKFLVKQFPFLVEYVDSSDVTGGRVLNISTREKVSYLHHSFEPPADFEIIDGTRHAGIDEVVDPGNMEQFLNEVMREVNISDNDINLLKQRFVSPLSRIAPDFYRFYITDTIMVGGDSCSVLSFAPKTKEAFGFTGRMFIAGRDSSEYVKRLSFNLPKSANVNFVDRLLLVQDFSKDEKGCVVKLRDDLTLELSLIPGTQGLYARRNAVYDSFSYEPDSIAAKHILSGGNIYNPGADDRDSLYWSLNRLHRISRPEAGVDSLMTKLRSNKVYYWVEKVVKILIDGYLPTAKRSKFDIGPVNSFISYNELEGVRLRFGGLTTANLSKRWFAGGYMAYGLRDNRFMYHGSLDYSFVDKKYHKEEFPVRSIGISHTYDIDRLGRHFIFSNPDNFLFSLTREPDRQIIYKRSSRLKYTLEQSYNFSITAALDHSRYETSRLVDFINGYGTRIPHYNETSVSVTLRYAPGEKFYQTRSHRLPVSKDAPVMELTHTWAPKSAFNNMWGVNKTEISLFKRFWLSAFGYTDIIVKGGHVWSRSPFGQLLIPNANLTYIIQPESFALMNPMEFINDSYVSWDVTYWANGALLNYIPLIKKLKLREAFAFRGVWGHLSRRNDPLCNPGLLNFPAGAGVHTDTSRPYMEIAVGLDNIFRVLRVDYVWRLSYRNTPGASNSGVQLALHLTF